MAGTNNSKKPAQKSGARNKSASGKKTAAQKTGDRQTHKKRKTYQSKGFTAAVVIVIILVFVGLWLYDYFYGGKEESGAPPYVYGEGTTAVHFLDVGQGDCIIVQLPDGKNMIIDGGDNKSAVETKIKNYIIANNITKFDYIMLTHTDADHCGGLDAVLKMAGLTFGKIFMPKIMSEATDDPLKGTGAKQITTVAYKTFVSAAVMSGAEIVYTLGGMTETGSGYMLAVYTPVNEGVYNIRTSNSGDINNVSPIMMLEFNGKRVMFTGDAQSQAENDFCDIAAGINTDVDVLKVAHHGSEGSSTERFLNKVRPEYAVISVGQNSYTSPSGDTSHPHQKALDRLAAVGAAVFRTDTAGDIVLTLTADGDILWYNSKNGDITAAAVYTGEYGALFLFLSKKAPCAVYD